MISSVKAVYLDYRDGEIPSDVFYGLIREISIVVAVA